MERKIIRKITIETDELWVVRCSGESTLAWCPGCGEEVTMITVAQAMALASMSASAICRQRESGRFHGAETAGGLSLICFNSLSLDPAPGLGPDEGKNQ